MKRIIVSVITATVLCMIASCGRSDNTEKEPVSSKTPTASAPAVASGQAATETEDSHADQTYIKSTFTDMSGREQVLDLGWINLQNKAVELFSDGFLVAGFGQVQDGHFYYLQQDRSGEYIVLYRDKGQKVAKVKCDVEEEVITETTLVDDELYLLCFDRNALHKKGKLIYFIKCVNLKTGSVVVSSTSHGSFRDEYWLMDNYIYQCEYNRNFWHCFDKRTGANISERSYDLDDYNGWTRYMIDGKVYYMKDSEPHSFIQIDLEKKERKVLFDYTPALRGEVSTQIWDMDEEGVYIWEDSKAGEEAFYKIPLYGGKMEKVENKEEDEQFDIYDNYKEYLEYIDEKSRIHIVNSKKETETIIKDKIKEEISQVICAKEGVFITCYVDWYYFLSEDNEDDAGLWKNDLSLPLYYMDYNGENLTQLRKEVGP